MSLVQKRSVTIHGHRTSFSLEEPFYEIITSIAESRQMTLAALVAEIDKERDRDSSLSSALRLYVLSWVQKAGKREPK
ncbi:ribbon-helix-helix domain-containing protein [Phyllobacterium sp. YR531]|uniref:ribbon-helix-helix domain-containing protein n=1 Tax=Phyllobacterium sp. YR531 TaxID=1144343 RepID=UPI00026F8FD7|nr:ribbon-helix-helix domain-containing protein [Phyllobacterium sp. YR531]EJN04069.1 hypothetical protein PMI41_01706 [Phyllobacterium sp. YR531]